MKTINKFLIFYIIGFFFFSVISCHKEPVIPEVPEIPEENPTPVDTLSLSYDGPGWGRLSGVPLLGYDEPEDRREEARQLIDEFLLKLQAMGHPYVFNIYPSLTFREIAMFYPNKHRLYVNAIMQDSSWYGRYRNFINEPAEQGMYNYLSDTIILYIGGGPDYSWGKSAMCLHDIIIKGEVRQEHEDYAYILAPDLLLPRCYNLDHTSIIEVPHSTAGLLPYYSYLDNTLQFFDYTTACGNWQKSWPENILSYEDASLLNDLGVEILRWNVEHFKALGKTLVVSAHSWGAYVLTRYLHYYPIEDFAYVSLTGINPNTHKKEVVRVRLDVNDSLELGRMQLGQEMYEMVRWRMLPWLTRQNLDRLQIILGSEDDVVGFPAMEEISALTDAGATFIEAVGMGHTLIQMGQTLPTDTVANYGFDNHLRIYTKYGVEEIIKTKQDNIPAKKIDFNQTQIQINGLWIIPNKY